MKLAIRSILLGAILCYSIGCGPKSAKLQKSVVPPDKTLFETGSNFLSHGQFTKARLSFQTLISTYPDSEMAPDAVFAMADSFYEEGGVENYLQAEDQYNNFIIFYPASPKSPEALMKMISLNHRMQRAPDRDQQYTVKVLQLTKRFLREYPNHDFSPIVKKIKASAEENLAIADRGVGQYYAHIKNFGGAMGRYQNIIDKYKEYSALDEIYYQMADAKLKTNNPDEAAIYLEKITAGYPFGKYFDDAKEQLKSLGKDVPPVNATLAAENQARVKPGEGFSPLKPFIDFGKALGFVGAPDQFQIAKKTVDAEKAKTAEAAAIAAAKAGGESQPSEDSQINVIITKNAAGETTTSLGANSSAANAQKDADKKKSEPRYKKKKSSPKPS